MAKSARRPTHIEEETPQPSPTRVQARQKRIAALKEQASAEGTTEALFPTAETFNFGSLVASYPVNITSPTTPQEIEEPVPEGELAMLAHEINKRLTLADRLDMQSQDHRLAAAIRLAQARKICEQKSMPFRKWSEAHIPHSFSTIRNLAKIGGAEDPKLALEHFRTKNAEVNRELRLRKKIEVQALIEQNPDVAAAIEAAKTPPGYVRENGRFVHKGGAPLGVPQHRARGDAGKFASHDPAEVLLKMFDELERDRQREFLKMAAEHMGALVEIPE